MSESRGPALVLREWISTLKSSGGKSSSSIQDPSEERKSLLGSGSLYEPGETHVYTRRIFVLAAFVLLSTMNNATQFAYTPLEKLTREHYGISSIQFTSLAVVFMVSGFTTRFIAMWLIDNHGLGLGVFVSASLNCVGGWLRFWPGSNSFFWLMFGQCFCAVAQGFIDIAGPKIAANWFPPKERTTATAFAQGPIFLAALLCYSVVPVVVVDTKDIEWYNFVQAMVMTVATAFVFAIFRGKPPMPPSASAAAEKLKFKEAVMTIFKNMNFVIMFLVFAIALGSAMSLFINLDAILAKKFSNKEADSLATIWISTSIAGGIFGGLFIDRWRVYKQFIIVSMAASAVGLTIFAFLLHVLPGKDFGVMAVAIGVMGFTACSLPAILEATIETIYPIPEATALGFLFLGLNVFGAGLTLGMTEEIDVVPQAGGFVALLSTVFFILISVAMVFKFKPEYRRLAYEKDVQDEEDRLSRSGSSFHSRQDYDYDE